MKLTLLVFTIFFCSVFVCAQTKLVGITYGKFDDSVSGQKLYQLYKTEYGKDIDLNDSAVKKLFSFLEQGIEVIRQEIERVDTLSVIRKYDSVISNSFYSSVKNRSGSVKFSLKSNVIVRSKTNLLEEFFWHDTSQLLNERYKYEINETNADSVILGYMCKKIEVTEIINSGQDLEGRRLFTIWATNKISPPIPFYSLLWLHSKQFSELTALYVEEVVDDPYPFILHTQIISVKKFDPK